MVTTIDSAGRIVVPKRLRDAAGLRGGQEVEIKLVGDRIEVSAAPRRTAMHRNEHGLLVAELDGKTIGQEEARGELERLRR